MEPKSIQRNPETEAATPRSAQYTLIESDTYPTLSIFNDTLFKADKSNPN